MRHGRSIRQGRKSNLQRRFLMMLHKRILVSHRGSDVPGEGHQPPLAYALVAPLAAWLPSEERQFVMPGNPRFTWATPASNPSAFS